MKKILITFILIFIICHSEVNALHRYGLIGRRNKSTEFISLSAGPTVCYGDTYTSPITQSFAGGLNNWDVSIAYRKMFPGNFGYRTSLHFSNYASSDGDYWRKFASVSNVLQLNIQGFYEIYFGKSTYYTPNSFYIFSGAGLMASNVRYTGELTYKVYKPNVIAPVMNLGVGYHYRFYNNYMIGAELNFNYMLSDYVDGFHSIFSKSNDFTEGISFTLGYKFH